MNVHAYTVITTHYRTHACLKIQLTLHNPDYRIFQVSKFCYGGNSVRTIVIIQIFPQSFLIIGKDEKQDEKQVDVAVHNDNNKSITWNYNI